MGYTLLIGEAEADVDLEDRYARVTVAGRFLPEAPLGSGGGVNEHTNSCWPSYSTWADFARRVGLHGVFFAPACPAECPRWAPCHVCNGRPVWWAGADGQERRGLLARHPGCEALEHVHLTAFREALEAWRAKPETERAAAMSDGVDYDERRLEWLVWWTDWALLNCTHPSFANS